MNKLIKIFVGIFNFIMSIPKYLLIFFSIGIIVGLITQNVIYGFFTVFGLILLLTIYIWGRQIYWWIKEAIKKHEN